MSARTRPESLDDIDGILVYADELMSRGDPHGNLITLQHGKKTKQAKAWLQKHAAKILGSLADNNKIEIEWQSGFIRKASLTTWDDEDPSLVEHYDQLRASPAGQLIRELELVQAPMDVPDCQSDISYCYEPLFARMAKHPLPTLRELDVGSEVMKPEFNCARRLDRVLAKHPGLEQLDISGGLYDFGSPKLPNLRRLRICADHEGANIRELAKADLPALEELDLHGGAGAVEIHEEPTAADFAKLLAAQRMPKLSRLHFTIHGDDIFLEAVRALLKSPLLRRLEELTLDFIDNAIADLVLEDPAPLRPLKKLALTTLRPGDLTPSRRKRLKAALPRLGK